MESQPILTKENLEQILSAPIKKKKQDDLTWTSIFKDYASLHPFHSVLDKIYEIYEVNTNDKNALRKAKCDYGKKNGNQTVIGDDIS